MPVFPTHTEQIALFESHEAPAPLLDLLGTAGFRAAQTALRLGLFQSLATTPLGTHELARQLQVDQQGITMLLDLLTATGYLYYENEKYQNSPSTQAWLCLDEKKGNDFIHAHRFWATALFHLMETLEESIRQGKPPLAFYQWLEQHPNTLYDFQMMLSTTARHKAPQLVVQTPLPRKSTRLLDVGGGHALYAAAYCQAHPNLEATVLDLPGTLKIGEQNLAHHPVRDRVQLQAGDFMHDDLGQGYDVVLLLAIVHCLSPIDNKHLLGKIAATLNPGGMVVILDKFVTETVATRPRSLAAAAASAFDLALFHLMGAQTYPLATLGDWLTAANLTYSDSILLPSHEQLIIAHRG